MKNWGITYSANKMEYHHDLHDSSMDSFASIPALSIQENEK